VLTASDDRPVYLPLQAYCRTAANRGLGPILLKKSTVATHDVC